LPTAAALLFGGFNVGSSVFSAQADQRELQLARLAGDVTNLVQALQNEREDTEEPTLKPPNSKAAAVGKATSSSRRERTRQFFSE
jgi:hypothetical protein